MWRNIEALIPYARNARTHSDAQIAQIAGSIREFGFTNPVLEQEPGEDRQCRGPPRDRLRMPRRGQQTQPPMRQDADCGHDKGDAQSGGDQAERRCPRCWRLPVPGAL
jgi:hypothetical protein